MVNLAFLLVCGKHQSSLYSAGQASVLFAGRRSASSRLTPKAFRRFALPDANFAPVARIVDA
jgi:hypothetical protein